MDRSPTEVLDVVSRDKLHVVFGGTKVVQSAAVASDRDQAHKIVCACRLPACPCVRLTRLAAGPDGGALGFVLRTGFDTSQGKLVRTILFSTERVTANNVESLYFILFLMIFAVAASAYVWLKGARAPASFLPPPASSGLTALPAWRRQAWSLAARAGRLCSTAC
jgi:cation-transporting ATPase 13A1